MFNYESHETYSLRHHLRTNCAVFYKRVALYNYAAC